MILGSCVMFTVIAKLSNKLLKSGEEMLQRIIDQVTKIKSFIQNSNRQFAYLSIISIVDRESFQQRFHRHNIIKNSISRELKLPIYSKRNISS